VRNSENVTHATSHHHNSEKKKTNKEKKDVLVNIIRLPLLAHYISRSLTSEEAVIPRNYVARKYKVKLRHCWLCRSDKEMKMMKCSQQASNKRHARRQLVNFSIYYNNTSKNLHVYYSVTQAFGSHSNYFSININQQWCGKHSSII
jgi:hypothetical protein